MCECVFEWHMCWMVLSMYCHRLTKSEATAFICTHSHVEWKIKWKETTNIRFLLAIKINWKPNPVCVCTCMNIRRLLLLFFSDCFRAVPAFGFAKVGKKNYTKILLKEPESTQRVCMRVSKETISSNKNRHFKETLP